MKWTWLSETRFQEVRIIVTTWVRFVEMTQALVACKKGEKGKPKQLNLINNMPLKNYIWYISEDNSTYSMCVDGHLLKLRIKQCKEEVEKSGWMWASVAAEQRGAWRQIQDMTLLVPALSISNTRTWARTTDIFHIEDQPLSLHTLVLLSLIMVLSMCIQFWQSQHLQDH